MGSLSLYSSPPLGDYSRSADMDVTGLPDGVALGVITTGVECAVMNKYVWGYGGVRRRHLPWGGWIPILIGCSFIGVFGPPRSRNAMRCLAVSSALLYCLVGRFCRRYCF
jgi:hypothetical protein